jgi:capsular exopolysaccharide synthesis family protein
MAQSKKPRHSPDDGQSSFRSGPSSRPGREPEIIEPLPSDSLRDGVPWSPTPPPVPPALLYAKALLRRWKLACCLGPVVAAVAAVATYILLPPPKYTAEALVHVKLSSPKMMSNAPDTAADFGSYHRTQITLIKSRLVLEAVLQVPEVAQLPCVQQQDHPVHWLREAIDVDFLKSPEIMSIAMSGDHPQELADLVNAVTTVYLREIFRKDHDQRAAHLEQLQKIHRDYQESLQAERANLNNKAKTAGSKNPQTLAVKHQLELEQLADAKRELRQAQSDLRKVEVLIAARKKRPQEAPADEAADAALSEEDLNKDAIAERLHRRIAETKASMEEIKNIAVQGENDPKYQDYKHQLDADQRALARRTRELRPAILERMRKKAGQESGGSLAQLQERLMVSKELVRMVGADVERLSHETDSTNESNLDVETLQEKIAEATKTTSKISNAVESLKVELQAPSRVTLLEEAEVPMMKDQRRKPLTAGMAGLAAMALVLACISWWEVRARHVENLDDVVMGLKMKLVGVLPTVPAPAQLCAPPPEAAPHFVRPNPLAPWVDTTSAILLRAASRATLRVVLITSAVASEGKTTLASHLAASLARAGRRTLLIDGDLRKPSLHQFFDLPIEPGFQEVLRGRVEWSMAARVTPLPGLWLMAAGKEQGPLLQLLSQANVGTVLDELKTHYEFIIVDSAPVFPVADALLIGQHVDAALFSIMRHVSRWPMVHAAQERLAMLGIPILGVVVNGARADFYGTGYTYAKISDV